MPRHNPSSKSTRAKFLPGQGAAPALEVLEVGFATESPRAPIICVHGAFGGAWMWKDVFFPTIASRGRWGLAFSFRGHGMSEGREKLNDVTLADYSADMIRILEAYPEPPVIVAHSLGALLTQRLIGYHPIRALVMLAPLPPEGMASITSRLFATEPSIWRALHDALQGSSEQAFSKVQDVVFSTRLSKAQINRYLPLMVMEGTRVMVEAHFPFPILPAFWAGIPALVVGGDQDRLVPSISNVRTAFYHGADCRVLPEQGHLLQLEHGAQQVAELVLDWLDQRNL